MRVVADDAIPWLAEALPSSPLPTSAGLELVRLPSAELPSAMRSADAALVRTVTRVDAALLAACPRLRFVGAASAGVDHLDVAALKHLGIDWAHAPGCNADAVADWVVTAWHELEHADASAPAAKRRVAVIGLGQTGTRVAARLEALGHEVVAIDPIVASTPSAAWPPLLDERAAAIRTRLADEGRLFAAIDRQTHGPVHGVTLHVPLTTDGPHPTRSMLDLRRWHALGEPTWCVNASRGEVFDVAALVDHAWHARSNAYLRLALDVWPHEPALPLDWLGDPRLVLATPHVAGYGRRAKWRATKAVCDALAVNLGVAPSDIAPEFSDVDVHVRLEDDTVRVHARVDGDVGARQIELPHDANAGSITRAVLGVALGLDALDEALRRAPIDEGDGAPHFLAQRRRAPHRVELSEVVVRVEADTTAGDTAARIADLTARLTACGVLLRPAERVFASS